MILSAILNLGNIEFESTNDEIDCIIKINTRKFLCNAAALLNTNEMELEDAITCHTRIVGNQSIK